MPAIQPKKVSIRHDTIMDFLLTNPTYKLGDVAALFGVSAPWLSVVINSDAFKIKLKEKQEICFSNIVVPLREKVVGVADQAVQKLADAVEHASPVTDKQFILDSSDKLLKSLGYSPRSTGPAPGSTNVQNNFYSVGKDELSAARSKMQHLRAAPTPEALGELEVTGEVESLAIPVTRTDGEDHF